MSTRAYGLCPELQNKKGCIKCGTHTTVVNEALLLIEQKFYPSSTLRCSRNTKKCFSSFITNSPSSHSFMTANARLYLAGSKYSQTVFLLFIIPCFCCCSAGLRPTRPHTHALQQRSTKEHKTIIKVRLKKDLLR